MELSKPYIAPRGQMALQKNRYTTIQPITTIINSRNFQAKSNPTACRNSGWVSNNGTAPSNVPAGQIYWQKAGNPVLPKLAPHNGTSSTNTTSTIYFPYIRGGNNFFFGTGSLWINS